MKAAIFVAPGVTLLDLAPAQTMLSLAPGAEVHVVAKTRDEISAAPGYFPIVPTASFAECPAVLDVLLVPAVAPEIHADRETLEFLADRGAWARWIASVGGGSWLLAAAGLLDGYRVAAPWAGEDLLAECGAIATPDRVVVDRNRVTSGVGAAVEHAVSLASLLVDEEFAREFALTCGRDPRPRGPDDGESPRPGDATLLDRVKRRMGPTVEAVRAAIAAARRERRAVASGGPRPRREARGPKDA